MAAPASIGVAVVTSTFVTIAMTFFTRPLCQQVLVVHKRKRCVGFMSRVLRAGGIMTATQRVSESIKSKLFEPSFES